MRHSLPMNNATKQNVFELEMGDSRLVFWALNTSTVNVAEWDGSVRVDCRDAKIQTARGWYRQALKRGYRRVK